MLLVPSIFAIGRIDGVELASQPIARDWLLIGAAVCGSGIVALGASAWPLQFLHGTPHMVGTILGMVLLAMSGAQLLWWFKTRPPSQP